jgi:hypothetical protein
VQGIYSYMPDTNHVSRVYCVASFFYLVFVLSAMLFRVFNVFCTFILAYYYYYY